MPALPDDKSPSGSQPGDRLRGEPLSQEAQHRLRMRHQWRDLIEDLIEDGRQRGLFDNLEGHGQPLELERNSFEGSAALAHKLLKENDLRPAWLAHRVDVQERIDGFRATVGRTWRRYETAVREAPNQSHRDSLIIGWDGVCRTWQAQIVELNKLIDSYNLKRPASAPELHKLKLEYELERAGAPRFLASVAAD
jgi:hypothetical protein